MKFSLAVAIALVGMSLSGWAQQDNTLKVKHAATKAPKKAPIGKAIAGPTATTSASKDLQKLEHQSAQSAATARAAGTTGKGPALKPAKDKPNPPINFGGAGGGKRAGATNQGANPYKGRLRQKGHQ